MRVRYRSLWLTGWAALAAVLTGLGFVMWPASEVVLLFTVAAIPAGVATAGYLCRDGSGPILPRDLVWIATTHACAAGVGLVGVAVLGAAAVPELAWLGLVLVAVSSPWVVAFVGRRIPLWGRKVRRRAENESVVGPATPVSLAEDAWGCSDRELCLAWRRSFSDLQAARTASAWADIAVRRQVYLDEFERRNPVAISAWLATGPRAAGGPEKYLSPPPGEDRREAS